MMYLKLKQNLSNIAYNPSWVKWHNLGNLEDIFQKVYISVSKVIFQNVFNFLSSSVISFACLLLNLINLFIIHLLRMYYKALYYTTFKLLNK